MCVCAVLKVCWFSTYKQCAAVITLLGLINVPPQNGDSEPICPRPTCQGRPPSTAGPPPTIRGCTAGRPQSNQAVKQNNVTEFQISGSHMADIRVYIFYTRKE